MTYSVLMGTLNPTHSLTHSCSVIIMYFIFSYVQCRK